MDPSTLSGFLLWMTAGGSVVAVSWILEQVAWFQSLEAGKKRWLQYGLSAFVGIAALAIKQFVPEATLEMLTPYFAVLVGVFAPVFLNQMSHTLDPRKQ